MKNYAIKSCDNCGDEYMPRRIDSKNCSMKCCREYHNVTGSKKKKALGLCVKHGCNESAKANKNYCERHANEANIRRKKYTLKYKLLVLDMYGGRFCIGCGESDMCVLSIDHINGNGNIHRKIDNVGTGTTFYQWLIRNNYPEGYRVLCMNCQFRSKQGVKFPHERLIGD